MRGPEFQVYICDFLSIVQYRPTVKFFFSPSLFPAHPAYLLISGTYGVVVTPENDRDKALTAAMSRSCQVHRCNTRVQGAGADISE